MKAVHLSRYFVDQFYLGSFEVMDSDSGLVVAQCSYFFDAVASDREITEDARLRAEAIAGALNLIAFNWKAPLFFE